MPRRFFPLDKVCRARKITQRTITKTGRSLGVIAEKYKVALMKLIPIQLAKETSEMHVSDILLCYPNCLNFPIKRTGKRNSKNWVVFIILLHVTNILRLRLLLFFFLDVYAMQRFLSATPRVGRYKYYTNRYF